MFPWIGISATGVGLSDGVIIARTRKQPQNNLNVRVAGLKGRALT